MPSQIGIKKTGIEPTNVPINRLNLIVLVIGIVIFQYTRNSESNINYENFNLVAPGILRTPDERFKDLKDYPFKPNYLTIDDKEVEATEVSLSKREHEKYFPDSVYLGQVKKWVRSKY